MCKFFRGNKIRTFKLIEGKNGPTTFWPLNANISGQTKPVNNKKTKYLTEDPAQHIYKKVESGSIINIDTIKQEMDQDLYRFNDTDGEINPYCKIIVNKAKRDDTILSQIEQWWILSNVVNYIQYDRHSNNIYNLDIKAIDQKTIRIGIIKKRKDKC